MTLADRVAADMPQVRADLEALVRIPSCAFPGFPEEPVRRAHDAVSGMYREAGYPTVATLDVPGGKPAVLAEAPGPPGTPTVLFYAHYDVQPAGDESQWTSPAFEPTLRDGRLYGRGAADDKSGVVMHAALMRAFRGSPPCTVRVVVEGDEEWGGPFGEHPLQRPEVFAADAIVVADVGNARIGEPTFTTTLRGMAMAAVECRTLQGAVHSGMFGGPAPDALMALIGLLSTLRDAAGDTAVDGVAEHAWNGVELSEQDFRELAGVVDGQPLVGTGSVAQRLFARPVANVVGLDAPGTHGAVNAVVDHAKALVSLRVPPGQDARAAQDALLSHLRDHAPWGVHVDVSGGPAANGTVLDTSGPAYTAARSALKRAYDRPVQEMGQGGSIPLVDSLRRAVPDAEILLFGAQDPMARIHAPDESVDLAELERAVLAQALFVEEFAGLINGRSGR